MTDLEFATCNLERLNGIYNNPNKKKFYELKYGDPIYCVRVHIRPALGLVLPIKSFNKYQLFFHHMEICEPTQPKARKSKIFISQKSGFIADKNVSAFIRDKRIYKDEIFVQIYGTSLEECIFKAEKATGVINLENKLKWQEVNL